MRANKRDVESVSQSGSLSSVESFICCESACSHVCETDSPTSCRLALSSRCSPRAGCETTLRCVHYLVNVNASLSALLTLNGFHLLL